MKKLYIVDAVNFLFRSYYAIGPMTNPKGESTNAVYGLIRSLYKIIQDFSPDYLIAVFDGPENKRSRTALYSEYKSHRQGMPEDLFPQLDKALKFCALAGIPLLSIEGVEADDTMGTIAKWAEKKGTEVFICTSDKDLCQLVSSHISVINPHKDNLVITPEKVEELFGVTPEQIVDLLAMVGDASDNIPGLEGFGAKTASSLLQKFKTLDYILAHPEKVAGEKKQETLKKDKEVALLSRQLATIHLHVDIPKEEEFYHLKQPDLDKLQAFYRDLHFMSLLKELDIQASSKESVSYQLVEEEEVLIALIKDLEKEKELCIDTETTDLHPMRAELVGLGLAVHPKKAWYVPTNGKLARASVLKILKPLLENPHIGFCGHNIKYDAHVLLNEGIEIKNIAFDTILASYLLNPHSQKHNLDHLSLEKFNKIKIPIVDLIGKGKTQKSMRDVPIEKVCQYCCEDVDYTCRLKELFKKELEEAGVSRVFAEIEIPLVLILTKMERNGIYLDVHKLEKFSTELAAKLKILQRQIYKMAGEEFNINSPKQMSTILFDKLKIKPPKKTATGFSTAADVLESLQNEDPIIKVIMEYRTLEKLRSTYADSLPHDVFPQSGRIHCTFNQSVAATGRLSCQDPNLQNIPVRAEEGRKIREAFKPQKTHWSFLSGDYSQVELRLLAHLSEDPTLMKAFHAEEDVHTYTASLVFNIPLKEVTQEMRSQAKAVNFGIIYGQQAFGLSQSLGISYEDAASFIDTYFQRYKKVKEFLIFCKESVQKTGRAITMTDRLRPIPEIHSKNPMIRSAAERLAINTPLQGTAADLIKLAMIQIDALLQRDKDLELMILQIHDELLFEVPDERAESFGRKVKKIMENVFTLKVPLVVDISIGKNWGEC